MIKIFFFILFNYNTFSFTNQEISKGIFDILNNLNFFQKQIIKTIPEDKIKDVVFYKEGDLKKIKEGKEVIPQDENEKNNKMIFSFQVEKKIKDRIDIIEKILDKYKKESKDKIDKLENFLKKEIEGLKREISKK